MRFFFQIPQFCPVKFITILFVGIPIVVMPPTNRVTAKKGALAITEHPQQFEELDSLQEEQLVLSLSIESLSVARLVQFIAHMSS